MRTLIAASSDRVDDGVRHTESAKAAMHEALGTVRDVTATLEAIHAATSEQLSGVGQVTEAVTHLDGVTQQNAAMVEQLAAATGSLRQQVVSLTQAMQLFRLNTSDRGLCESDAVALRRTAKESTQDEGSVPKSPPASVRPRTTTARSIEPQRPVAAASPAPQLKALPATAESDWTSF